MSTDPTTTPTPDATPTAIAWSVGSLTFRLDDPRLFLIKAFSVLALSFALLPILAIKSSIPAVLYVGLLIVTHIFVLAIYLYRVRFRDLDPNRRSLFARVIALAVVTYLLVVVSRFEPNSSWLTLSYQLVGVTVFHALLLILIMVRVDRHT